MKLTIIIALLVVTTIVGWSMYFDKVSELATFNNNMAAEKDSRDQTVTMLTKQLSAASDTASAANQRAATAEADSARLALDLASCQRSITPAAAAATASAIAIDSPAPTVTPAKVPAPKKIATMDKSPVAQAKRGALIAKAHAEGYFGELLMAGDRGVVQMEVTTKFMNLTFTDKQLLAALLYAQYFDGTDRLAVVNLVDDKSRKEVGNYSALRGGLQME